MELGVNSNPNIEMLDRMYNASLAKQGREPFGQNLDMLNPLASTHNSTYERTEKSDKAAIIQRNINLAPFYRDYSLQKRELLAWIKQTNLDQVKSQGEHIL